MTQTNHPAQPNVSDEQLLANAIPLSAADLEGDDQAAPAPAAPPPPARQETGDAPGAADGKARPRRDARFVKTFVTKLKQDLNDPLHGAPHCIEEIDRQINNWLKEHPGVTVKFATMVTGEMMSKKGADSALIMSVWVGRSDVE
jgi:hypothetical protein